MQCLGVEKKWSPSQIRPELDCNVKVIPFYCLPVLSAKILQTYSGTSYGKTQMNFLANPIYRCWIHGYILSKPHGQMDKLWELHWRILPASPLMNITLEKGCLWRKSDLLCAFSSIFSLWLSVQVQLTLLTIWVKWSYWIMFVANYNCFAWILPLVTLFTVKKIALKDSS